MVAFGAPAPFLGKPKPKPLTEEELAKKAAEDERKKKVETLMVYQEKIDAIQKLETELALSKQAAIQASPATFGLGHHGIFSPQLGLGSGGLAALLKEGASAEGLASPQARLAAWLRENNPGLERMSEERRAYVLQYQRLEEQLRHIMEQNAVLEEQNHHLQQTIRQTQRRDFGGPYEPYYGGRGRFDYNEDGADPIWAAEQERRRANVSIPSCYMVDHSLTSLAHGVIAAEYRRRMEEEAYLRERERMGYGVGLGGAAGPPWRAAGGGGYPDVGGSMMSPGFRRAREADRLFGPGC